MTFNDGCLGSRNDEERSEMRYVMWIADLVNHQIFERILHFRFRPGVFLFECLFPPLIQFDWIVYGLFLLFLSLLKEGTSLKRQTPVKQQQRDSLKAFSELLPLIITKSNLKSEKRTPWI